MILAVDVGNTRIKAAVFEGDTLLESFFFQKTTIEKSIQNILNKYKNISYLVVASVSDVEKHAFSSFEKEVKIHFVSHKDIFPFQNCYETPKTLGIDRMVLSSWSYTSISKSE